MSTNLGGNITLINRLINPVFQNTRDQDIAIFTDSNSQFIHLGCGSNASVPSTVKVTSSNLQVVGDITFTGSLLQNGQAFAPAGGGGDSVSLSNITQTISEISPLIESIRTISLRAVPSNARIFYGQIELGDFEGVSIPGGGEVSVVITHNLGSYNYIVYAISEVLAVQVAIQQKLPNSFTMYLRNIDYVNIANPVINYQIIMGPLQSQTHVVAFPVTIVTPSKSLFVYSWGASIETVFLLNEATCINPITYSIVSDDTSSASISGSYLTYAHYNESTSATIIVKASNGSVDDETKTITYSLSEIYRAIITSPIADYPATSTKMIYQETGFYLPTTDQDQPLTWTVSDMPGVSFYNGNYVTIYFPLVPNNSQITLTASFSSEIMQYYSLNAKVVTWTLISTIANPLEAYPSTDIKIYDFNVGSIVEFQLPTTDQGVPLEWEVPTSISGVYQLSESIVRINYEQTYYQGSNFEITLTARFASNIMANANLSPKIITWTILNTPPSSGPLASTNEVKFGTMLTSFYLPTTNQGLPLTWTVSSMTGVSFQNGVEVSIDFNQVPNNSVITLTASFPSAVMSFFNLTATVIEWTIMSVIVENPLPYYPSSDTKVLQTMVTFYYLPTDDQGQPLIWTVSSAPGVMVVSPYEVQIDVESVNHGEILTLTASFSPEIMSAFSLTPKVIQWTIDASIING